MRHSFALNLAGKSEGLWDMEYPADGQLLPDTPFWWSEQFRLLVGFEDEDGISEHPR